jgi:serine/threonine-protein kinase
MNFLRYIKEKKYAGKHFGQCTIESLIGEGRYGLCFLARIDNGQKVIVKKLKPSILKKNLTKNSYEPVILSRLTDKRIPELLGVINEKGFYGYILEYKNGYNLEELIFKHNHNFSREEFYNIGIKLIDIIKYIHENKVVHRDIRIPNVLIDDSEVFLVDFGLARWVDKDKYPYDLDFSYLGDFLLYILYSSFKKTGGTVKSSWYEELQLTYEQKIFLKKLLRLEPVYENIGDIKSDFIKVFKP